MVKESRTNDFKQPARPKTEKSLTQKGKPETQKGKYAEKYKYVRFVEKKKVLRKMRQLQKDLISASEADKPAIEETLAELRKDLMYIDKFPGKEKYISLFPSEGQLSEECLEKQKAIRAKIINLTTLAEIRSERKRVHAVKNDDFFASVDDVEKPARKQADPPAKKGAAPASREETRKKPATVHPSWEAKKSNEKLTGSLSQTKFEGNRMVFDDDE